MSGNGQVIRFGSIGCGAIVEKYDSPDPLEDKLESETRFIRWLLGRSDYSMQPQHHVEQQPDKGLITREELLQKVAAVRDEMARNEGGKLPQASAHARHPRIWADTRFLPAPDRIS